MQITKMMNKIHREWCRLHGPLLEHLQGSGQNTLDMKLRILGHPVKDSPPQGAYRPHVNT